MTIYVSIGDFLIAVAFVLLVLAAGIVVGRLERRDRREVAAVERRLANEQTTVFAVPPVWQDQPALPWLEPEQTGDLMPINAPYGFDPSEPIGEDDRYWLTPEGQRSVEAIDHAYAALPDPEPAETELPGMWERADYTGGLDEVRPPSVAVAQKPDDDRDDDYPRGLAAGIGRDLEQATEHTDDLDDEPATEQANAAVVVRFVETVVNGRAVLTGVAYAAPPSAQCRRGALIERIAARLAPLAAWLADVRTAVGIDHSPTWRVGELATVIYRKHGRDETSTRADDYQPRHAEREPDPVTQASPLTLVRRNLLAPAVMKWRRHHAAARSIARRFVATQATARRAA